MQALARAHTPEAVAALVAALDSPRERVSAAVALLDRGWGKPTQPLAGDRAVPLLVDFRWSDGPLEPQLQPEPTLIADGNTDGVDEVGSVWGNTC